MMYGQVVGALGVFLGAVFTAVAIISSARIAVDRQERVKRVREFEEAGVQLAISYRAFRRYMLTQDVEIKVIDRDDGGSTRIVENSEKYWNCIDGAEIRAQMFPLSQRAETNIVGMRKELNVFIRERAKYAVGGIPGEKVIQMRDQERKMIREWALCGDSRKRDQVD